MPVIGLLPSDKIILVNEVNASFIHFHHWIREKWRGLFDNVPTLLFIYSSASSYRIVEYYRWIFCAGSLLSFFLLSWRESWCGTHSFTIETHAPFRIWNAEWSFDRFLAWVIRLAGKFSWLHSVANDMSAALSLTAYHTASDTRLLFIYQWAGVVHTLLGVAAFFVNIYTRVRTTDVFKFWIGFF